MLTISPDKKNYTLHKKITSKDMNILLEANQIEYLSFGNFSLITIEHIKRLKSLNSIKHLQICGKITRGALRNATQLNGLKGLTLNSIRGSGIIKNFDKMRNFEFFFCFFISEQDLLQVIKCKTLKNLYIPNSDLSQVSLDAILSLSDLQTLDVESTPFNDAMAKKVSHCKTITSLNVAATQITKIGLKHLVSMKSLRSLDIWANNLTENDLNLLLKLPKLENISLGLNDNPLHSLDPDFIVKLLLKLKNLNHLCIDGIPISPKQQKKLCVNLECAQFFFEDEYFNFSKSKYRKNLP